jgi:hypothetical protein
MGLMAIDGPQAAEGLNLILCLGLLVNSSAFVIAAPEAVLSKSHNTRAAEARLANCSDSSPRKSADYAEYMWTASQSDATPRAAVHVCGIQLCLCVCIYRTIFLAGKGGKRERRRFDLSCYRLGALRGDRKGLQCGRTQSTRYLWTGYVGNCCVMTHPPRIAVWSRA